MLSAMALLILLLMSPRHAASEWPCSDESTFQVATYVKTEDELNAFGWEILFALRNLETYFPALADLPSNVESSDPSARLRYPRAKSAYLDSYSQEIDIKIPLDVVAEKVSKMEKHWHPSRRRSFWNLGGLIASSSYYTWHGCDGTAYFSTSVVLKAAVQISGSGSLRWRDPQTISNFRHGECLNYFPQVNDPSEVIMSLQQEIKRHWVLAEKRHHLSLPFGARLSLEFHTPHINALEGDGTRTISGSISGCVQDSNNDLYAIHRSQRNLQEHCHSQLLFIPYELESDQRIHIHPGDFLSFTDLFDIYDEVHLVFRPEGSHTVAIYIGNATEEVNITLAETSTVEGWQSKASLSSPRHLCSSAGNGGSWWQRGWQWGEKWFSSGSPSKQVSKPHATRMKQDFWLSIKKQGTHQHISVGIGSVHAKHVLVERTIETISPLKLSLKSLDSKATWQVNSDQKKRVVCRSGMPTDLEQGHGAVRLSTQLFGAILGVQSRQLQDHVSNWSGSFLDAKLNYRLEVGKIQMKVTIPEAVNSNSFLELSVQGSKIGARCDGRPRPLLSASLDQFQGSASVAGHKDRAGNLSLSMALDRDGSSSVRGLLWQDPNVPLSQSAGNASAVYVLNRLIPNVNEHLKTLALVLPPWLAKFIPCDLQNGRCQNTRLHQHVSFGHETGFVEFSKIAEEVQPSEQFSVENSISLWLKSLEFLQSFDLRLVILLLACVWLALIVLAYRKSLKYAVSAFVLGILVWSWYSHSPFAGLTITALLDSGLSQDRLQKENVMQWFSTKMQENAYLGMGCTLLELLLAPLWGDLFKFGWQVRKTFRTGERADSSESQKEDFSESQKECIAYWSFSILVLVSQFWLLVGMPMTLFLGRELGAREEDGEKHFPSSALNLSLVVLNCTQSKIHNLMGTVVSSSFTSMFVVFMGLYLIYFLLPLPVGIFLAAVAFVVRDGACWSRQVANMTALCLLITELLSSAASLGPLVIAYQILGGTAQWWLAAGLMGVCRPLVTVPYTKSDVFSSQAVAMLVGFAYVGISLAGAMLLWESYNGALDAFSPDTDTSVEPPLVGRLSSFTFAIYLANVWFVSSSAYLLLHDAASGTQASAEIAGEIQNRLRILLWKNIKGCAETCGMGDMLDQSWTDLKERLKTLRECFFPWLVWLLEMDAVVSFLYHCCRVVQLGGSLQTVRKILK